MSSTLPFPVRIAAGLVSEALGRARRLPADISALPVTVLGQVAKLSFELNQQLAELAGEGDRLIAGLRSPEEPPQRTAWSTIDDEDEVAAKDPQAAATWAPSAARPDAEPAEPAEPVSPAAPVLDDDPRPAPASPRLVIDEDAPTAPTRRPARTAGRRAATSPKPARVRAGTSVTVPASATTPTAEPENTETPMDRALIADIDALEVQRPAPLVGLPTPADDITPDPVDISSMSIGQLRGRVRNWPAEQVRSALEQEQREKARPAFLTVLTNRLSTLARGGA